MGNLKLAGIEAFIKTVKTTRTVRTVKVDDHIAEKIDERIAAAREAGAEAKWNLQQMKNNLQGLHSSVAWLDPYRDLFKRHERLNGERLDKTVKAERLAYLRSQHKKIGRRLSFAAGLCYAALPCGGMLLVKEEWLISLGVFTPVIACLISVGILVGLREKLHGYEMREHIQKPEKQTPYRD